MSFCSCALVLKRVKSARFEATVPKHHLKVALGMLNKEEQFDACSGTVFKACLWVEENKGKSCNIIQYADHVCKHSYPLPAALQQAKALQLIWSSLDF